MDKTKNDTLKTVLRLMRRQNVCENFLVLQSVASQLNLRLDFEEVEFDDDDLYCFPIPLRHIYSALTYENKLYILCNNFVLHIVDLNNRRHRTKVLEKQPGFGRLAQWIFQLKASCFVNKLLKRYHQYSKYMKKKNSSTEDLVAYLNSLPEATEALDTETGNMIAEIIGGMKSENLLESEEKESVIELTFQNGTYYCLLDKKQQLKRLFRK